MKNKGKYATKYSGKENSIIVSLLSSPFFCLTYPASLKTDKFYHVYWIYSSSPFLFPTALGQVLSSHLDPDLAYSLVLLAPLFLSAPSVTHIVPARCASWTTALAGEEEPLRHHSISLQTLAELSGRRRRLTILNGDESGGEGRQIPAGYKWLHLIMDQ